MTLAGGAEQGASVFARARRETVRYHEDFYSSAVMGQAGTWLARPHRLLRDSLSQVRSHEPAIAYDLGSGPGRHTIPLLQQLPPGSEVYAVDLLSSALRSLRDAVPPGLRTVLHTRQADLDDFAFQAPADLVLAFSVIEHLPDLDVIRQLLNRVRTAVTSAGVVAIGIVADRFEIDDSGDQRPALIESPLTSAQVADLLSGVFGDFTVVYQEASPACVREDRDGKTYTLASTLITWLGTRSRDTRLPGPTGRPSGPFPGGS